MKYILALDQGTTSSRAILFDHAGTIAGVAQREFQQIFPQPGWVEHDPQEIWATQIAVATEALGRAHLRPRDIAAIGITNQRETTIVWNRETGQPLYNAIVWQDRRTAEFCDRLRADGHAEDIRARTGLVLDAYFSGSKIRWILDNVDGARALANAGKLAFGTVDTWLVWKLTSGDVHITDVSNASRTLLFNIHTLQWDEDLLRLFDIPASMLPAVKASSEVYGRVSTSLGISDVPVAGIAGDQQAALFGQMCVSPGLTKNTYGTGCFLLQNTGTAPVTSNHRLVSTVAWQIGDRTEYALEGSVFIGGAVVQWLRDGLGIISGTTAAHIARAALESIAYQVADLLDAVHADAGIALDELRVDGGAATNDTLLQFQADVLGVAVVRPAVTETTALGAAYLAGLAVGFWGSVDEISGQWSIDKRFDPRMPAADAARLRERWQEALRRSQGWIPATERS